MMPKPPLKRLPQSERRKPPVFDYEYFKTLIAEEHFRDLAYSSIMNTVCNSYDDLTEPLRSNYLDLWLSYAALYLYKYGFLHYYEVMDLYAHALIDIAPAESKHEFVSLTLAGRQSVERSLSDKRVAEKVFPLIDSVSSHVPWVDGIAPVYMTKSVFDFYQQWSFSERPEWLLPIFPV